MITARISAGSKSILSDMLDQADEISPLATSTWKACFYQGTKGAQPWGVWMVRMDEDAHELQIVHSSGLVIPPDGYEFVSGPMPDLSSSPIPFKQRGCMPSVVQSPKGGGGGVSKYGGLPVIRTHKSAVNQTIVQFTVGSTDPWDSPGASLHTINGAKCVADLWAIMTHFCPQGKPQNSSFFYNSSNGNGEWGAWVAIHNMTQTTGGTVPGFLGSPQVAFLYDMGGMANPPDGSENLPIPCPVDTFKAINAALPNHFIQIADPVSVFPQ